MKFPSLVFVSLLLCFSACLSSAYNVSYDGRAITIDGKRRILLSGSIHYPRSPPQMWPDLIRKAKEGGLDAIETYVFWDIHEPRFHEYDFTGNRDIVRFIKTVQAAGLYAVLRIGPYVCAEWNYGGFPVWLHNLPGVELRTDNAVYKNEMQTFTTYIVDLLKKENLFASQGGPIILSQIENEYGNVMSIYGDAGKAYIQWCANFAESLDIGVPWIMCQQSDAPQPMINTCNGWYCDSFQPNNPNVPKMWTENWTGWFKAWGGKDPHRTAEDIAFSVARFFQANGTFQNYYMYHGGTNFGRTSGGPYIVTSYDYDAPLDEYGNLNQPKYGHLKQLHLLLKSMEEVLTYGDSSTQEFGNLVNVTTFSHNGQSSCFISNGNETNDATITFNGVQYTIPAWSVSILPDCKKEVYNTAKVNTQTSVIVKRSNQAEDEPSSLSWAWRPEYVKDRTLLGMGSIETDYLVEQKAGTNDTSDYLWYMTSVHLKKDDPILSNSMTLQVNSSGHVLYAYVNGERVGSQWGKNGTYGLLFESNVSLKPGTNQITLLSATVGLKNYGPQFDLAATGVKTVSLISKNGDEEIIKDLSTSKWTYKTGIHGEEKQLYRVESPYSSRWLTEGLPINDSLVWYKTTFKPPLGTDPVVVDLQGLGKGHAWVNGKSIGRYWPSFLAGEDGCSNTCDYRGAYSDTKCVTNCGQPSQRWYHVPRSFLRDDSNTLILFEELGGNPSLVNFQTTVVGSASVNAYEGNTVELSCQGRTISDVKFASFGNPEGSSGTFAKGSCESANSLSAIQKACVGQESCLVEASESALGTSNCDSKLSKRLVVEVVC
ncbi:Beta-galactosidase 7 [Ranunculus cassubicifolius]